MRYFIFILLCVAFKADGQIIRANPFYTSRAVAVVTDTLLLDSFPAVVGYSLRKLRSNYTGSAIRVRRDSTGNAETDIGFVNNYLDTVSLKNHCRNNSCMVTTWYSQGDSTKNFTQATAASQPRIMTSGVIERSGGDVALRFDISGTTDFMDVASSTSFFSFLHKTGQSALFLVCQIGIVANPNAGYYILSNSNGNCNSIGYGLFADDRSAIGYNETLQSFVGTSTNCVSSIDSNNYFIPNTATLYTNLLDNGNATSSLRNYLYKNGGNGFNDNSLTTTPSTSNSAFNLRLGRQSNSTGFPLNGFLQEIIMYNSDQSSNRTAIENNINRNWLIY